VLEGKTDAGVTSSGVAPLTGSIDTATDSLDQAYKNLLKVAKSALGCKNYSDEAFYFGVFMSLTIDHIVNEPAEFQAITAGATQLGSAALQAASSAVGSATKAAGEAGAVAAL